VAVDLRDPICRGGKHALDLDFTKELGSNYPDAFEEIDVNLSKALVEEIKITTFVDSDHAHHKVSRRLIAGILIFVDRTPVMFLSKRQGAIEASTHGVEFWAMKNAVEELIALCHMLHQCLGAKVEHASLVCGDDMGVVQNATASDSLLKKKHVVILHRKAREAAAAGIAQPIKIGDACNFAVVLPKAQTLKCSSTLVRGFMHG
jgi:hypothetical protein